MDAEATCKAFYDPDDNRLHIKLAFREESDSGLHLRKASEQAILGAVAAINTFVLDEDVQNDPQWDPSADRKTGFTTRSILAKPIKRRGELLGVLEVINKSGDPRFTETDGKLVEVVATRMAIATDDYRLVERTVQSKQLSVIGRMASPIIHYLIKTYVGHTGLCRTAGQPGHGCRVAADVLGLDIGGRRPASILDPRTI